jgi:hypothetical protein
MRKSKFSLKTKLQYFFAVLALIVGIHQGAAQGTTAFTYQGQLHDSGTNANGNYTMTFTLYDSASGNNEIGTAITTNATLVNGLFTVNLDFGAGAFSGNTRWLNLTVQSGSDVETLTPRVQVLPAPYALFANAANTASNLTGTLPSAQLSGSYSNVVTFNNPTNTFIGQGGGLTEVNAATLGGFSPNDFAQLAGNPVFTGDPVFTNIPVFTGDATFTGNPFFYGIPVFNGTPVFNGNPIFTGNPVFTNIPVFTGDATFTGNPFFYGIPVFNGTPVFNGNPIFNGNPLFTNNPSFTGNPTFSGIPAFNQQFNMTGGWSIGVGTGGNTNYAVPNSLYFYNGAQQMIIGPSGTTLNGQPAAVAINGGLGVIGAGILVSTGNVTLTQGDVKLQNGNVVVTGDILDTGVVNITGNLNVNGSGVSGNIKANDLLYNTADGANDNAVAAPATPASLEGQVVLNQMASLPISTWTSQKDPNIQHIGPKAHDFQAAFGLGKDDQTISLVDESGVALAAIQGLNEKLKEDDAQINALKKRLSDLEQAVKTSLQK